MNADELFEKKLKLEQEIVEIESELHLAKAKARKEKVYADVNWFNRTTRSLNNKKIELRNLNLQMNHQKKTLLKDDFFERFYEIARVSISSDVFEIIESLAKHGFKVSIEHALKMITDELSNNIENSLADVDPTSHFNSSLNISAETIYENDEIEKSLEAKRTYKREYMKQWRKNNPEKVKENEIRYWERKAQSINS